MRQNEDAPRGAKCRAGPSRNGILTTRRPLLQRMVESTRSMEQEKAEKIVTSSGASARPEGGDSEARPLGAPTMRRRVPATCP